MERLIKLPVYIGRDQEQELLWTWIATITATADCRALYFQTAGGLGKTFLLEQFPLIVERRTLPDLPQLRIGPIVDLYAFEQRTPTVIETTIIQGLHQTSFVEWYRLPAHEVDEIFYQYNELLDEYNAAVSAGQEEQQAHLGPELRKAFIAGWNMLSDKYTMILRFDTLEVLFNAGVPSEALISRGEREFDRNTQSPEAAPSGNRVIDWMAEVLPQLTRTLVLLCGRPAPGTSYLVRRLGSLLAEDEIILPPLTSDSEIQSYLKAYYADTDIEISAEEVLWIRKSTGGQPLLLTCYVVLRDMFDISLEKPFPSREEFENHVVTTILNPLEVRFAQQEQALEWRILIYCLYFLAYGRRGLQYQDLMELLKQAGLIPELDVDRERVDGLLRNLHRFALIKTAYIPGFETNDDTRLLFLHDEIFQLIDKSGKPDALGLGYLTLEYLSRMSRERVKLARKYGQQEMLIKALSDHMYYDLICEPATAGYWTSYTYIDLKIRERQNDAVQVLSDTFWSTLTATIGNDNRRPRIIALHDATIAKLAGAVTYEDIIRRERALYVKWLRSRGQVVPALKEADTLLENERKLGIFPNNNAVLPEANQKYDWFMYLDLLLTRADLIRTTEPLRYEEALQDYDIVLTILNQPTSLQDVFLEMRREYYRGLAHTLRGQMQYEKQHYEEANNDARLGRLAYEKYRGAVSNGLIELNDDVTEDLGQAMNNQAYNYAQTGNLRGAEILSKQVLKDFAPRASPYRRALWYNTNALILTLQAKYEEALWSLSLADEAAKVSQHPGVQGLVKKAFGQVGGARLKKAPELGQSMIETYQRTAQYYDEAEQLLLKNVPTLRELFYDRAGLERDIATFFQRLGDPFAVEINAHFESALAFLNRSLDPLSEQAKGLEAVPPMHQVNVQLAKVVIFNRREQYDVAEAEIEKVIALLAKVPGLYAQILSGKVALQKGFMILQRDKDYQTALKLFCIAVARICLFSKIHRDRDTFEKLISDWIEQTPIPLSELSVFLVALESNTLFVEATELHAPQPAPQEWSNAWQEGISFFREYITVRLET